MKPTVINSYLRIREVPAVSRWLAFKIVVLKGIRFNYDAYYSQWQVAKHLI